MLQRMFKISVSKFYFIIILLFMSIIFVSYSSYAIFSIQKEKKNMISITTGNFIYRLESNEGADQKITVEAGKSKIIDIKLFNLNVIENYYQLFYEKNDAILIYYQEKNDMPNGFFTKKDQMSFISLVIVNQSNKKQEVVLGAQGGFKDEVLLLEEGRAKIDQVLIDEVLAPELAGGSIDFQMTTAKVRIKTPGKATSGVKAYEYYISNNKDDVPSEKTVATGITNDEIVITDRGYHYVYYRSISYIGNKSKWTDAQLVKYDDKAIRLTATDICQTGSLLVDAVRYSFDVNSILAGDIVEYKFKTSSSIRNIVVDFNDYFLCTDVSSMCMSVFFEEGEEYIIKGEIVITADMLQDRYSKLRFLDINVNEEGEFDPNTFVTSYEVYVHRL